MHLPPHLAPLLALPAALLIAASARAQRPADLDETQLDGDPADPAYGPGPGDLAVGDDDLDFPDGERLDLDALLGIEVDVASSRSRTVFTSPSMVSVIDRHQIETYNFRDVGDALRTLAGVDVNRTYLKQSIPTVRGILQEHYATKILVLVDGVPSWLANTGEGNIERISINEVERIEVLKGPASVVYGTNALAGAINIVTRRRERSGGSVELRGGDRGYFGASAEYNLVREEDGLNLFVGGSGFSDQGVTQTFVDEAGVRGAFDDLQSRANVTLRLRYDVHHLRFSGFYVREGYIGVVPNFLRGIGEPQRIEGYTGRYNLIGYLHPSLKIDVGAYFDFGRRDIARGSTSTVALSAQRSNIEGFRAGGTASARWQALDWLAIELGGYFDYRRSIAYENYNLTTREIEAENEMDGREVNEFSVFAQAEIDEGPFSLAAGARLTQNELFDTNVAARATAVYSFADTTSIKLVAGQSFRAPTLFELYFQTPSLTVSGNPELDPETSNSIELAFLTRIENLFVSALGYFANYESKIFRTRDPETGVNRYVNGEGAIEAFGAELEMSYRNPRLFDAFFNYYFVDGNDGDQVNDDGNYNFRYVPQHSFTAGLAKSVGPFSASTVLNYVHSREGFLEAIDPDFTFDVSASFAHDAFRHSVVAKNLTNENVENPEFVRRRLNTVPGMFGRAVYYALNIEL